MSSAVYFDQIKQLVELQKVDDAIFAVRQELDSAPRDLEDLEQRFEAAEAQRNRVLDKLAHLQEQQKRLSLEIDDDSARIKKSKNKLMQVGNTREYHAMMREMDSMEKVNRSREEEKMTLLEELQLQNDALAEIDRDHSALKAELEVKRDGLEEKLQKARGNLEELNKKLHPGQQVCPSTRIHAAMSHSRAFGASCDCGGHGRRLLGLQYRRAATVLYRVAARSADFELSKLSAPYFLVRTFQHA